jgi:cyclophilin family peptidyl-prolyl cis-trans isomerase
MFSRGSGRRIMARSDAFGSEFKMKVIIGFLALAALASPAMAKKKAKPAPAPAPVAVAYTPTAADLWHLDLSTGGSVVIAMRPDKAPNHVARIRTLTRAGFYDGLLFHRVIDGFMAQTGDPKGTGEGGSPLPDLKAEFNDLPHLRGTLSMARPESVDGANSQFFIMLMPTLRLDGRYTAFGRVTRGMEYVDLIEKGEPPANPAKIIRAWIEADGPNAPKVPLVVPAAPAVTTPPAPGQ